ncbi:MAG: riboflavin synthase [Deltaproteobacteria bacterium]|nr:riboflavin synthase [Deltaproteobacteria bacterium]
MFTGIITAIGKVRALSVRASEAELEIECPYDALVLGESIAVDGVCLTVVTATVGGFTATASDETLNRSTLAKRSRGDRVNLERALRVDDRLGGHLVSGHVDGMGMVRSRTPVARAERWSFEAPPEVLRFIAEKGSITIDGMSLTVNAVQETSFDVMLVPFTLGHTALGEKRAGAQVNLEVDVIARYVARLLEGRAAPRQGVTLETLARAGFLGSE